MVLTIPNIIPADLVQKTRAVLAAAVWEPGVSTAKNLAAVAKNNLQVVWSPDVQEVSDAILLAVQRNDEFAHHVMPASLSRPIFNRYDAGMSYGEHIDNPIMGAAGSTMRTDVSVTLFLSDGDDYGGGVLWVGDEGVKELPGTAAIYPTDVLHHVTEIESGQRLAAVFWVQSLIRDPVKRQLLGELGDLARWARGVSPPEALRLGQLRANLFRRWMD